MCIVNLVLLEFASKTLFVSGIERKCGWVWNSISSRLVWGALLALIAWVWGGASGKKLIRLILSVRMGQRERGREEGKGAGIREQEMEGMILFSPLHCPLANDAKVSE